MSSSADPISEAARKLPGYLALPLFYLIVSMACWIILNSICQPYFIRGTEYNIGTNSIHNYSVVNPGPWKSRNPIITFAFQSNAALCACSPLVRIETNSTYLRASQESEMVPGGIFSVAYSHPSTTSSEPNPILLCDSIQCKEGGTFNLIVLIPMLCLSTFVFLISTFLFSFLWIRYRITYSYHKMDQLCSEVGQLKSMLQAKESVEESKQTLVDAENTVNNIELRTQKINNPRNGKTKVPKPHK